MFQFLRSFCVLCPRFFFFNHLQVFDVVLAYLEFRGLFLKIKKGKGRKARSSVFLWKVRLKAVPGINHCSFAGSQRSSPVSQLLNGCRPGKERFTDLPKAPKQDQARRSCPMSFVSVCCDSSELGTENWGNLYDSKNNRGREKEGELDLCATTVAYVTALAALSPALWNSFLCPSFGPHFTWGLFQKGLLLPSPFPARFFSPSISQLSPRFIHSFLQPIFCHLIYVSGCPKRCEVLSPEQGTEPSVISWSLHYIILGERSQ